MRTSAPALGWIAAAAIVVVTAAAIPFGVAHRNREYLQLLHGTLDPRPADAHGPGGTRSDQRLDLRRALMRGDWPAAKPLLERLAGPDRLAALLVVREAERRVEKQDPQGARSALGLFDPDGPYDAIVWYRIGKTYLEHLNDPGRASGAYRAGASRDPLGNWSEGRYQIAMIYRRQENWPEVIAALAMPFGGASDDDLRRSIQPLERGGPAWQGTFLALGEAYERLGRRAEAEATYQRIAGLRGAQHDWTMNRALAYLSRLESERGDLEAALRHLAQALDLAESLEQSRADYETDTATRADHLIMAAVARGTLADLMRTAEALTRPSDRSSGAWYLRGLVAEARCDLPQAETAYARARSLAPPNAGSFLTGRPSEARRRACRPQ